MANRSPPMPFIIGSVTPVTAFAAIAASTALPPRARTCTAACAASGWLDAATPCCEAATERPGTGRAAASDIASAIMLRLLPPQGIFLRPDDREPHDFRLPQGGPPGLRRPAGARMRDAASL